MIFPREGDVLLAALTDARQRKEQAARDTRLLLAYAREIVSPRPYRLADLANAAGMSISGVRTAYTHTDIKDATRLLGSPGSGNRHIENTVTALLTAPEHTVPGLASAKGR